MAAAPGLVLALGLMVVTTGCGRSAPEGAAAPGEGTESGVAGIQIVSEQPVIVPPPTSATVATTATTTPEPAGGSYVVEPGDTLSVIAERFGVTIDALSQANGITDVNTIRPGQQLTIPG